MNLSKGHVFPYLARNFVTPYEGRTVRVYFTASVKNVCIGSWCQIGPDRYVVTRVSHSGKSLVICNRTAGNQEGITVVARNSDRELQYPFILLDKRTDSD